MPVLQHHGAEIGVIEADRCLFDRDKVLFVAAGFEYRFLSDLGKARINHQTTDIVQQPRDEQTFGIEAIDARRDRPRRQPTVDPVAQNVFMLVTPLEIRENDCTAHIENTRLDSSCVPITATARDTVSTLLGSA